MKAWLQLIRFNNLLLIALSQILISFILFSEITTVLVQFVLCTFFFAASGNIINDIFDIATDTVNKPNKLIIGTLISKKKAQAGFYIANCIGLCFAILNLINTKNFVFFTILISIPALLYIYSKHLKSVALAGNLLIASLTALPVLLLLFIYPTSQQYPIYIYSFFAFFINLAREITKDIEDIKGDKKANLNTLPVLLGTKSTLNMIRCIVGFILICLLTLCLFIANRYFKFYIAATIITPLVYCFKLMQNKHQKKTITQISNMLKITIAFGILSVLFLYKT